VRRAPSGTAGRTGGEVSSMAHADGFERSAVAPSTAYQRVAREILAAILVLLGIWTIRGFLPAIVWAVILAIAIWPLYRRATRQRPPGRHNVLMPTLFTLAVALVFVVPLLIAAVQVGRESHDLYAWYAHAQVTGLQAPDWLAGIKLGEWNAADWWKDHLGAPHVFSELLKRFDRESFISFTRQFGLELVHRIVLFAFMLLTLFFLFRDGESLSARLVTASRRMFGPSGERIGRQMIASVHGTVDGLVLVGLGEGLILGIAYVVAGVPHPALLGSLTAVAAMIPFGAPLIFGIAALLLVAQGAVTSAVVIVVLGTVVLVVADHIVRPVLIGGSTRLPFVWVLFGILGGVEAWGLLGLFLGPALMAALILLWREISAPSTAIEASETADVAVARSPAGAAAVQSTACNRTLPKNLSGRRRTGRSPGSTGEGCRAR
jgi:predicted PurR-regulated permease PerM